MLLKNQLMCRTNRDTRAISDYDLGYVVVLPRCQATIGSMTPVDDITELAVYPGVLNGKPMTRALRRFHRRRLMRHARLIFAGDRFTETLRVWAEKRHDQLCRCLCYLCHNKRQKFGVTIQEQRVFQSDPISEFQETGEK